MKSYMINNFEILIVVITAVCVLITNTPFNSTRWFLFSVFVCIIGLGLVIIND